MDESKLLLEIWQKYGINGVLAALSAIAIWKHWIEPKKEERLIEEKKKSGDYVSFEDVRELKEIVQGHIVECNEKNIINGQLQTKFAALEEKVARENTHLFNQSASLFEKLDKMDMKIDSKFDILTKILMERK